MIKRAFGLRICQGTGASDLYKAATNGDIMENQKTLDLCLIQKLENFPFMSDENELHFAQMDNRVLED
jgi:hypothetical protein